MNRRKIYDHIEVHFFIPDDGNVNLYQTKLLNFYLHKKNVNRSFLILMFSVIENVN